MKKSWIIILIIAIIIIGIIAGLVIYNKKEGTDKNIIENEINEVSEKIIDECTEEFKELNNVSNNQILQTNADEIKISPNCLLILKRYYSECEHTINEYLDIPENLVNKTQENLKQQYQNWEVKKYSSTEIILYKEFNSSCGQHFILRNDDGKIAVYRINEDNEEEMYEKTEISVDYLTDTDKIQIENGIKVNGIEELKQLIEDFE